MPHSIDIGNITLSPFLIPTLTLNLGEVQVNIVVMIYDNYEILRYIYIYTVV